jgi:hypothetical protein
MKLNYSNPVAVGQRSGFTAIETLVVMATLVILCGSMIMCNLFGVSMAARQQIWLTASDDASQSFGKIMTDVRSGCSNYVGSGNLGGFTNASTTTWQQGNALMIYGCNSNGVTNGTFTMYYYDGGSSNLYRTNWDGTRGVGNFDMVTANMVMTNNMYNSNIFSAYNVYNGVWVPETNGVGTPLILICLAFTKLQNPQVDIAPGSPVDFYQIVTMIASRNRP